MKKVGILFLFLLLSSVMEAQDIKLLFKYPFAVDIYEDTLTHKVVHDSLAKGLDVKITFYRQNYLRGLQFEATTNDSGAVIIKPHYWHDGVRVSRENIQRMSIDFPNSKIVKRVDKKVYFEPARIENMPFILPPGKEYISVTLPLNMVTQHNYTIGEGDDIFKFAIIADLHIGEDFINEDCSCAPGDTLDQELCHIDFGTCGWDDEDIASQNTPIIKNICNVIDAVNSENVDFIVILGDVTDSGEKSELSRAVKLFQRLNTFYIPVIGNHDVWPFVGRGGIFELVLGTTIFPYAR